MDKPASPLIIQTGQMPNPQNTWLKLPTSLPRLVFLTLSLIIVGELIWGAWFITKNGKSPVEFRKTKATTILPSKPSATIKLALQNNPIVVGGNAKVDITIVSARKTIGTDLVIKYDPNFLTVIPESFTKGLLYDDYLGQVIDNKKGVFKITGLSTQSRVHPNELFGTLNFKVLATGVTKVSVDFQPSITTDSNVIDSESSKDILDKVGNLELNII